jgi:hypothetical protein
MLDPVSIGLAISTASFEMIRRELEQMHGDMGRWMSATAEIAATAESAENAGVITRMLKGSGNIESIATQAVLAKKQIEQQRYELMVHIRMKYGMKTWDDMNRPDVLTDPSLLESELAFESALWFFQKNDLFKIADEGVNDDTIKRITKRVNGGYHGLDHRTEETNKIYGWLAG